MTFGEVLIRFGADIGPFQAGIAAMGGESKTLGSTIGSNMAMAGVAIVAAGIGVGIASVKMAGDFQSSMTQLVTGAGEAESNIAQVSAGILALSVSSGTSTKDLAAGMYLIESAGYHGATGLAVLTAAAQGAKVGNASLAEVANGVTTAMTDYASKNLTAAAATNFLIAVVANGKTHMGELASSMSTILPTAGALGVQLVDVGGAMATMTGEGTPAAVAATYLRQMLLALAAPAAAGAKALTAIGLTTQQVSSEMKVSLPATLQMIMTHLKDTYTVGSPQYVAALKAIAGGSKQMQGMLELTGTHLKTFSTNVGLVSGAMTKGGSAIQGWSLVQGDFNFKMDQAKAAVQVFMITLGTALLPVITNIVSAIAPAIASFTSWMVSSNALQNTLSTIGAVIGGISSVMGTFIGFLNNGTAPANALKGALIGVAAALAIMKIGNMVADIIALIPKMIMWTVATYAQATAAWAEAVAMMAANWPIYLIIAAIALLVVGIILLVQHWGAVVSFLSAVWGAFVSWFMALLTTIGTFFANVWSGLISVVSTVVNAIVGFFISMWARMQPIITIMKIALAIIFAPLIIAIALLIAPFVGLILLITHFQQVMGILRSFLAAVWAFIVGLIVGAISTIGGWFTWLYNHNTYIQRLCDLIRNFFAAVIAWIQTAWATIVAWLVGLWNGIAAIATTAWNAVSTAVMAVVNAVIAWLTQQWNMLILGLTNIWNFLSGIATTAWNAVSTAVMAVVNAIISWVTGQWNAFSNTIQTAWNALSGFAQTAWDAVTSVFTNAWNNISSALGTLLSNITNWFSNLASGATQWGINVIQNFINGIASMVGAVASAVQNVVGTVTNFLGFHSPTKEGPGKDSDKWGPALASGFAKGIISGLPLVQAAMNSLMLPVSSSMNGAIGSAGASGAGIGGGQAVIHNHIYLDSTELSTVITPKVATHIMKVTRSTSHVGRRI